MLISCKTRLFCLIITAVCFTSASAQTPEQDSLALVALYNSTGGASWTNTTNWLDPDSAISTWYGVTVSEGRVTGLTLNANNLNGTLPTEIGDLTALGTLYLYGNSLSGEIPAEIGDMSSLVLLRLDVNQLTGTIPPQIGNLAQLVQLYLNSNALTGTIPTELSSLSNLTKLILSGNELTGTIPSELSSLTQLEWLQLSHNQLTGAFPVSFEGHTKLYDVEVDYNVLTDLPDLSTCPDLWRLHVDWNQFTFEDLEPNVGGVFEGGFQYSIQAQVGQGIDTTLYVGESIFLSVPVGGTANVYQWMKGADIPGATYDTLTIGPLTLEDAGTYQLEITNDIASALTLYSKPYNIAVRDPGFESDSLALVALYNSTDGPNWTTDSNWLIAEDVNYWYGVEVIDQRVRSISLAMNELSGPLPESIGNLTAMTSLNLMGNELTDTIPSSIGNLIELTQLRLSSNQLSGAVPATIADATQMLVLYLQNNQLSDLPDLGALTLLQDLYLGGNRFTFEDLEPNWNLGSNITSYVGQANIGSDIDTTLHKGDRVVFAYDVGGIANLYQWWKSSQELTGETNDSLVFDPVDFTDVGYYYLYVTNDIVPGLTIYSNDIIVSVDDIYAPATPTNLEITGTGAGSVTLAWDHPDSADVARYRIFADLNPQPTTLVDSTSREYHSATISGLTYGLTYYFRLTALDDYMNESGFSDSVSAFISGPPVWTLPDTLWFAEDDSLVIDLDSLVSDDRDPDSTLRIAKYDYGPFLIVTVDSATHVAKLRAPEDRFGTEMVSFIAHDPHDLWAADTSIVVVTPINDPPQPFALMHPDSAAYVLYATSGSMQSVQFMWNYAYDVDVDSVWYRFSPAGLEPYILPVDTNATQLNFMLTIEEWEALTGPDTLAGSWNVTAFDGLDSVSASNGPWPVKLVIDVPVVGLAEGQGLPEVYALHSAYPNPFNPATTIRYDLPEAAEITLMVYDLLGREVVRLVEQRLEAGYHQLVWNGRNRNGREVPTGMYIVLMATPEYRKSIKLVMLK